MDSNESNQEFTAQSFFGESLIFLEKLPVQGKKTPGKPKILENSPP
jgi:hypothetical protein